MKTRKLTQERLKESVRYNPETGEFTRISTRKVCKCVNSEGAIVINIDKIAHMAHRLAFLYMTGNTPPMVDHINGDRLDNRWCNLRQCTHAENLWNSKRRKDNKSGYKGVSEFRPGVWRARTSIKGKVKCLGFFKNIEDAAEAVRIAREKHHGEFARHE